MTNVPTPSSATTPPSTPAQAAWQRLAGIEAAQAADQAPGELPVTDRTEVVERDTLTQASPELAGLYDIFAGEDEGLALAEYERMVDGAAILNAPDDPDRKILESLYTEHLSRAADGTGLAFWGAEMKVMRAEGKTDTEITARMHETILGSPEYIAKQQAPAAEPPAATAPVATPGTTAAGATPFISQFAPAGADGSYTNGPNNCGPTSVAMIVRAFGGGDGLSDAGLINRLDEAGGTDANGTPVVGIGAMAEQQGLSAETKWGTDVNWIASQLDAGKLVVANGDYFAMAPHENAAKAGTGGHYVAVIGRDGGGNFLVNDPADQPGGTKTLTPSEMAYFLNARSGGGNQIAIGR